MRIQPEPISPYYYEPNRNRQLFDTQFGEKRVEERPVSFKHCVVDISKYNPTLFMQMLWNRKFDISTSRLNEKDKEYIKRLNTIFLEFMERKGYDGNRSYDFKKIDNDKKVFFASVNYQFIGYIILDSKFVVFVPKNQTLEPIFSISFEEGIKTKIKSFSKEISKVG